MLSNWRKMRNFVSDIPADEVINYLGVIWLSRNDAIQGRLILTPSQLIFKKGILSFKTTYWKMPLAELSHITLHDHQIKVYTAGYLIATFNPETFASGQAQFIKDVQHRIQLLNSDAKNLPPIPPPTKQPSSENTAALDDLDNAIIQVVQAHHNKPAISYKKLLKSVKKQHKTTLDRLQLRLAKLIRLRQLPGYLTTTSYHQDNFITIQCQVCNQTHTNPNIYWQCTKCYQFLCHTCHDQHALCPSHRRIPTFLTWMPLRCDTCHKPILDLSTVANYQCPHCHTPFPPP